MHFPRVHRVPVLLPGTHQGALGKRRMNYYLDELSFRFNRRTPRSSGLLSCRLPQQAVVVAPP